MSRPADWIASIQPHLEPELIPLMTPDGLPFADRIRDYLDTGSHLAGSNVFVQRWAANDPFAATDG